MTITDHTLFGERKIALAPPVPHTHPYEPIDHTHPAGEVEAGTFDVGAFTFPGALTVDGTLNIDGDLIQFPSTTGNNKINLYSDIYSLGVQSHSFVLRTGGSTGDNLFLFEKSDGTDLASITSDGRLYVSNAMVRQYDSTYAQFGNKALGTTYQFLLRNTGLVLVRATADGDERLLLGTETGSWEVEVTPDRVDVNSALYCNEWFRSETSGLGWYHQAHGGGWFMQDTTYMRVYNNKEIYTATKVRGGNAGLANSASYGSNYATFGYSGIGDGTGYCAMQDINGVSYYGHASGQWSYFRSNNSSCFQYQRSGSYTDFRFVGGGLPALAGNTMIYATGSGQVGYSSSSIRFKTVLGELSEVLVDDTGQPILNHSNPALIHFVPVRFHWNENVANYEAVNARYPNGLAGFIAEDIYEHAPDAVTLDGDNLPAGLDTNAMLAYLVGAIQHVHRGGHKRLDRMNALEGEGGRLDQIEGRLDSIDAEIADLWAAFNVHGTDNRRHIGAPIL